MLQKKKNEDTETKVENLKKQLETKETELDTKSKEVSIFICFPQVKNRLKRVKVPTTIVAAIFRLNNKTVKTRAGGFIHQVYLYINKYSAYSFLSPLNHMQ